MDTSRANVVSLTEARSKRELSAAVKALMCAIASLAGEIRRLERVTRYGF